MFGTIISLQELRDGLSRAAHTATTQSGQPNRIALACKNRVQNRDSSDANHVTQDVIQLEIHFD
jgi:hypothetical protein